MAKELPSESFGVLDPTLPRLFVRLLVEQGIASSPQCLRHPTHCQIRRGILDWKTNFMSANPTEVFPVLYRCSNEMDIRTCYNQRQNLEFLDEVHIPSHAQCLSPSLTIQAVSGSFASSAESNQQRHIAYPEDFGLSS